MTKRGWEQLKWTKKGKKCWVRGDEGLPKLSVGEYTGPRTLKPCQPFRYEALWDLFVSRFFLFIFYYYIQWKVGIYQTDLGTQRRYLLAHPHLLLGTNFGSDIEFQQCSGKHRVPKGLDSKNWEARGKGKNRKWKKNWQKKKNGEWKKNTVRMKTKNGNWFCSYAQSCH